MTRTGKNIPCTVIEAGPCVVTQVRTTEADGYEALQLGFDDAKKANKAAEGHAKKAGTVAKRKVVEFQGFEGEFKLGDAITVDHFEEGEFVDVAGTSKGKGFQGVVKRHGFAGVGQATHGQHNRLEHLVLLELHLILHVYSKECEWQDVWVVTSESSKFKSFESSC